jgi:hypothetical protein
MNKVTIQLFPEQIAEAVERLPEAEKLELTERLEKETLRLRWRRILRDIDARLKKFPISRQTVLGEIRAYRKANA